ncbi:MAG: triose-phosphate isomerase [Chlamydiales bacterium]
MRKPIIAANWKMYKTTEEAVSFIKELAPKIPEEGDEVYLAVPFTFIAPSVEAAKGSRIKIGAQNMNDASEGAFTGEIAASMLIDAGAQFVILGHSERRRLFHEDNLFINRKVKKALLEGIQPLLCIGESKEEREAGAEKEVIYRQLVDSLDGVTLEQMERLVIAYEPVWAIGTGTSASYEQAEEMHAYCRQCIKDMWNPELSEKCRILYGGSVKPENATQLMEQPNIDGLLVGSASLNVETFHQIIHYSYIGNIS